jgi:putative oxidoreductase
MTRASSLPAEHIGGPVRSSHPEQGRSVEQLVRQAQPVVLSLFRIVVGLLFACHGLKSLFGLFQGIDGHGPTLSPVNWPGGCAADIQLLAGISVMLGLLTRPAALIASGSMAYAYFEVHLPTGFWPIADHGEPAVMFCWAFFLLVFTGPGSLTVGSLVHRPTRREPAR